MPGDASHADQNTARPREQQVEHARQQVHASTPPQLTPRGQAVTPGSYATRHTKMMQLTATKSPRPSQAQSLGQDLDAVAGMGQQIDQQCSQPHALHQPTWNAAGSSNDQSHSSRPLARLAPEQPTLPLEADTSSTGDSSRPTNVPKLNLGHMLALEPSGTGRIQSKDPAPSATAMPPPPASARAYKPGKQTGLTMGLSGASAKRVLVGQHGAHPGQLSSASTQLPLASGSTGPESWRRLSHELNPEQAAAALDRREQLRQFQAQKAAKSRAVPPTTTGRASLGGSKAAARPPLPSSQLRTGMLTAAAGVPQAANKPLPDEGGDELLTHRPTHNPQQEMGDVQHTRNGHTAPHASPTPAHQRAAAMPGPPTQAHGSFSVGGSLPSTAHGHPSMPSAAHGRLSLGGPSSTAGNMTARSTGGGSALYTPRSATAVAVVSAQQAATVNAMNSMAAAAAAGFADVRQDIRNMKLQELQLRYLNARMERSLQLRRQKGEQALAACLLAISDMERSACAAQAAAARSQLQQRASTAARAMQPVLQQLEHLQARPQNPDAVLSSVRQALLHSLTSVPLICGAVCGDVAQADLEALEAVMTRGMHALMQIDGSLQPLLSAPAADLQGSGAPAAGTSTSATSAASIQGKTKPGNNGDAVVRVPTARILTDLVACIKSEVHSLQEVLTLLQQLRSKQLLVSSYQAQLVQIRRRLAG